MAKVYGKDKHLEWHHGRLGGFLQDEKKCLYGITCRHVTKAAHDGSIFIKDQYNEYIEFGNVINRCKIYQIIEDIDLIAINESMRSFCDTTIRNSKNEICEFAIYEGPACVLFGQSAFIQCLSSDVQLPEIVPCRIAASHVYHMLKEDIDINRVILLEQSDLLKPGESGNLLLMENRDKTMVYILGILFGGKCHKREEEYVLCLRFDYGKQLLGTLFGKTFSLPNSVKYQCIASNKLKRDVVLQVGFSIWVKDPENVAKTDFILFEHLMMLINCFSREQFSARNVQSENTFEAKLNDFVNSRNENLISISCENVEQKCFLECMIGCQYLYSGDFEKSDKHLKDAVRIISKTSCRNRFLCNMITYVTWQLLQLKQLDNMRALLKKGEKLMLKLNECNACPLKSIGYHYFDYARYHKRIQKLGKAMCMARKSLEYFKEDERYRGRPSNDKCFALSMIARLNLQCGDKFETRHLPVLNLDEAQDCISSMKSVGNVLPVVEKVTYYLTKTDLHYRRGEMVKAKQIASKCFALAQQNNLKQEQEEAEIRIRELALLSSSLAK